MAEDLLPAFPASNISSWGSNCQRLYERGTNIFEWICPASNANRSDPSLWVLGVGTTTLPLLMLSQSLSQRRSLWKIAVNGGTLFPEVQAKE